MVRADGLIFGDLVLLAQRRGGYLYSRNTAPNTTRGIMILDGLAFPNQVKTPTAASAMNVQNKIACLFISFTLSQDRVLQQVLLM
ncbi:hypothetical protein D3C74_413940 [compost metagenome]